MVATAIVPWKETVIITTESTSGEMNSLVVLAAIVLKLGGVMLEHRPHLTGLENTSLFREFQLRMNDLLIGSLLHFLALCLIQTPHLLYCVKVTCRYTHHSRKSCQLLSLFGVDIVLHRAQLYLFL